MGKRFFDGKEQNVLSLILTGMIQVSWQGKQESSFFYLKGVIENTFRFFRKEFPQWKEEPFLPRAFSENLSLFHGKERMAHCSTVAPEATRFRDLKQPVFFAEINLDEWLKASLLKKTHTPLEKYPPVRRDIAFLVGQDAVVDDIQRAIAQEGAPYLKDVFLFDQYFGGHVPAGKRSLAFSLEYQKPDGTFTDDEIRTLHEKISVLLKTCFNAEIR